jgi:dienelactone hydrolase
MIAPIARALAVLAGSLALAACACPGSACPPEPAARGPTSTDLLGTPPAPGPRVVTEELSWTHEGDTLRGVLYRDASREGRLPGVLVVPEWWGLGAHAKERAARLAAEGWVALACDMYGDARLTADRAEAAQWAGRFRGTPLLRTRARAGLDALAAHPSVDAGRLAALGFCFGGTASLELAWSGAPLRAAVSFHGSVTSPAAGEAAGVKARVLVLHGADDAGVTAESLRAFEAACRAAGIDWGLVQYGGAVHSFTNPAADGSVSPNNRHHPRADRRSWVACVDFLREALGP